MHVLAESLRLGHRGDHALAEVVRMWTGETEPFDATHRSHRPHQVGEVVPAIEVGIDGLPKQYNFRNSRRDRGFSLANHFGKVSTALGPASGGHDAVCALVVAAALDRNPRLHTVEPAWGKVFVVLVEIELDSSRSHAGPRTVDQRRKLAISVWPDDQTQVLDPIQ